MTSAIYSIRTTHGDVRVIKTFKVTGEDEEACFRETQQVLNCLIESLELKLE